MEATMDGRGLIGETTFGDGAAIAAVVMNTVTGAAGGPRAAKTAALMSRH